MFRKVIYVLSFLFISCMVKGQSRESYEEMRERLGREFSSFRESAEKDFEDFRNRINEEYASLLKKSWQEYNAIKGIPVPDRDKTVPPVVYPYDDKDEPVKDNLKPFDEIVPVVKPKPQPDPIVPIEETPAPVVDRYYTFDFFNTKMQVRIDDKHRFTLRNCSESEVARAWTVLSGSAYNNVINDCLRLRSQHKLCDWEYLLMLRDLSDSFFKGCTNESVLFAAYLYCQSGYKMRLACADSRLYLLYASNHLIYDKTFWTIDGERFYALDSSVKRLNICQAAFPNEKPLSLQISTEPLLSQNASAQRSLQSKRYQDVKAVVNTNENLIKFFDSYPTSMIDNDFGTRWAMYANTPLSQQARQELYPALKRAISGKSQIDAVNRLLNFVQTAFVYEYDDKVWGCDRAFFADETLYYPYCDCEDRSILFSLLVRDLLGLKVVLVYYPGHLATAVNFTESVTGDYLAINGNRYVICDPTFIGAPVGATMPNMDNASAKVILLE